MNLELYLDLLSPPCRAIYIFAKKNSIRFDYFPVDTMQGHQHSKEFEEINILKKVPVLREGDFVLVESVAILLYLARRFNTPVYWYPPDLHLKSSIDEYLAWQQESIHVYMNKVLWMKMLIPMITGQQVPKEKMDNLLEKVQANIQLFSDHFLKDKQFVTGKFISLADLTAAVEMMQAVGANHNIFQGKPKLFAWCQRVEESVGSKLFEEAHERLLNFKKWDTSILDPNVKDSILIMLQNMAK